MRRRKPTVDPLHRPKFWRILLGSAFAAILVEVGPIVYVEKTTSVPDPLPPVITSRLGPRTVQSRSIAAATRAREQKAALPPYQGPPCDHGTVYCDERVFEQAPWEHHEALVASRIKATIGYVAMHARALHPHDLIDLLIVPDIEAARSVIRLRWTFPDGSQEEELLTKEIRQKTSFAFKRQPGLAGWAVGKYEVAVDIQNGTPTVMRFEVVPGAP